MNAPAPDAPVSERIRYRLVSAGCRHHANDNIAAFMDARGLLKSKERARSTSQRLKELRLRLRVLTQDAKKLKSQVKRNRRRQCVSPT